MLEEIQVVPTIHNGNGRGQKSDDEVPRMEHTHAASNLKFRTAQVAISGVAPMP